MDRFRILMIAATLAASASFGWSKASAASIFCPTNVNATAVVLNDGTPSTRGYALRDGNCTNTVNAGQGGSGAFSGAALASQALSDLSQSATSSLNRNTMNSVQQRRLEEQNACPAGQIRTADGCVAPRPVPVARPAPQHQRAAPARKGEARAAPRPVPALVAAPLPEVAPPPLPALAGPRFGVFAHGFGDYEERNGRQSSSVTYFGALLPFQVLQSSSTRSAGFLGGIDMTLPSLVRAGDGLVLGLLGGYTSETVTINTRTIPGTPISPTPIAPAQQLAAGSARTHVTLDGPSVGGYASYFAGPLSLDQTVKADFFDLNQTFNENLGFGGFAGGAGFGGAKVVGITGSGSTSVVELSAVGNLNYRLPLTLAYFIEPTVGYEYIHSFYDANAVNLALRDGDFFKLQGGARVGYDGLMGNTLVETSLTGLVYDDVLVSGGFIQNGAFGSNVIALDDEGKVRGEGILTVSANFNNGFSGFIQGDVRGGDNYFGAGGKGGLRYQW